MGRMDLEPADCPHCEGSGLDPRKRKRPCPRCGGSGRTTRCTSCGHLMPCPGTEEVLDQSYCSSTYKNSGRGAAIDTGESDEHT